MSSIFPKSTSYAEYTCGDVRMLETMCSAIFLRMMPIGSMRTFSPGVNTDFATGAGVEDGVGCGAGAALAAAPLSTNERMSFLVTRPEMPVPLSWAISMPCSFAMLRTTGDDFVRRRDSKSFAGSGGAGGAGAAFSPGLKPRGSEGAEGAAEAGAFEPSAWLEAGAEAPAAGAAAAGAA